MGIHASRPFTDWLDAVFCLLGFVSFLYICKESNLTPRARLIASLLFTLPFLVLVEEVLPRKSTLIPHTIRSWISNIYMLAYLSCAGAALMLALRRRVPTFQSGRRDFLRLSSAAVCAAPAAAFAFGFAKRKQVQLIEVDLKIPDLPADLHGLRLLQLSDIHMGPFFSKSDLARVVDASNGLHPDLAFITGDLISDEFDPLDDCLKELSRLRSTSGVWGCMGNHELYAKLEGVTERKARALGMTFLRQRAQRLRFGNSTINLSGVDFKPKPPFLRNGQDLVSEGDLNLLLAHTPQAFPEAADQRFDLVLSGHTHGGQINLDLLGKNLNIADFRTPYTKGLYTLGRSRVYVNSGLGTIGVPVRLGAPAEITLIRLCKS